MSLLGDRHVAKEEHHCEETGLKVDTVAEIEGQKPLQVKL